MTTVIFDTETAAVRADDPAWLARAEVMRAEVEAKIAALLAEPVVASGSTKPGSEAYARSLAERTAARDAKVADLRAAVEADIEAARMATALDPTLGRVVCVAWVVDGEVHSVSGDDERDLLLELSDAWHRTRAAQYVAHNGKRFDVPFLRVRALRHGLRNLARVFGGWGAKPWELRVVDTIEAWPTTGAEAKGQRRLPMLARLCGVDCEPDTITGADVPRLWESSDPDARRLVVDHCRADVLTLARVWSVLSEVL